MDAADYTTVRNDSGLPSFAPKTIRAHCYYRERGGEDVQFDDECALLERAGWKYAKFIRSNSEYDSKGLINKAELVGKTVWSKESARLFREVLEAETPRLVHFHNTFPLISPSCYAVCNESGVRVVQNVSNYRLICPNAYLFRKGAPCEWCVGKKVPWPSVVRRCHETAPTTPLAATMLSIHNVLGTWHEAVDAYVAPSEFTRQQLRKAGFPPDKLWVLPNFIEDPGYEGRVDAGSYFLYVGRISAEKRVLELAAVAARMQVPLWIRGDGPLLDRLRQQVVGDSDIRILGRKTPTELKELMRGARAVVYPSHLYETFGRAAAEAAAVGVPIIAPAKGAIAEIVLQGDCGLVYEDDVADSLRWAWTHPDEMVQMGQRGRASYLERHTPSAVLRALCDVYDRLLGGSSTIAASVSS